jgi:hypothetical protein
MRLLMNILDNIVSINALFIQPCNLEKLKSNIFNITGTSNLIFSLDALLQAREFDQKSLKRLLTDEKNKTHCNNLIMLLKIFNPAISIEDVSLNDLELIGKWPCISIVAFDELLKQIRELHNLVSSYGFPIPINLRLGNNSISELAELFSRKKYVDYITKNYSLNLLDQITFDLLMKKLIDIDKNNLIELSTQFMFLHYSKVSNDYVRVIKLSPLTLVNLN